MTTMQIRSIRTSKKHRAAASEVLARFGRLGPRMTDGRLPFRCQQRRWVRELPRY
jgi:hypothetical protein